MGSFKKGRHNMNGGQRFKSKGRMGGYGASYDDSSDDDGGFPMMRGSSGMRSLNSKQSRRSMTSSPVK